MQNHLVIIGNVWPEPSATAAGSRMLQLIDLFKSYNFSITFLTSAKKNEFSFDLASINIQTRSIELNNNSFNTVITTLNPTAVLFDRFITEEQYGWRVTENCPNALKILDTEDLHFLRKARENAFKKQRNLIFEDYLSDIFKREIAAIYRCDLSLIISEYEIDLLTNTFKIDRSLLFYLPFLIDNINKNQPTFSERKHFMSIGNFLHEPNWQTVLQLKTVWKTIKKELPETELHIYGAYTSNKVNQLHNEKEGFLIKGRANSSKEVYKKYRVLLAPIPFGAGLKGKLFESMQYGLPNITNSIGAEAMQFNKTWNGFITNNKSQFITKTIQLYTNENIWNKCQNNGYIILENKFNTNLFKSKFIEQINYLINNTKKHRQHNFLGQLFQHHTLQSTKFMSKWIEVKNSLN
ncbi:glycosyltransferase [Flavobacterium sp.]|uniref:glycosyltransferase n=1 Tax=Flavobacterium sp. TaxID=239 RepID=UPI0035271110